MWKYYKLLICKTILFVFISLQIFILYKYSNYTHFDEWVGRGLYPGIAFSKGFDLYEPNTGPHVTGYGWTSALFYSLSGFCNNPNLSITMAFWTNILSFAFLLVILNYQILSKVSKDSFYLIIAFSFSVITLSFVDDVTLCISKIHSDVPATIFLISGNLLCALSLVKGKNIFLYFGTFLLVFSVMAKLPTLPGILAPIFLFIISREIKFVIVYAISLLFSAIICFGIVHFLFGLDDYLFYHSNQLNGWGWVDRHNLFDGEGAEILHIGYFEALPILFRFLTMYIQEYWYFVLSNILIIFSYFYSKNKNFMCLMLSISYFLTLASCLAALAHWGAWHNALFICNMTALISVCTYIFHILIMNKTNDNLIFTLLFSFLGVLLSLPVARYAMSSPSIENSPYQQAYEYLKEGNKDIYFGWYPIPHALCDNSNYTSLEVPIWTGMSRNFDFAFGKDHFPSGVDVFATCKVGYGSTALKPYLGAIREINAPPELSHWRLFKISNK